MKNLLVSCFLLFSTAIYAQQNLEKELVGTWSVVEVIKAQVEPSKINEVRDIRLEFSDDHTFRLESSMEEHNIDGTWLVKGNSIGLRSSKTKGLLTMDVQQVDGKWFFRLPFAELEVRKD